MTIVITPEYWQQPGSIRYNYVRKPGNTLHNVGRISDGIVYLWTINAWGNTYESTCPIDKFHERYKPHGKPSLYDQMDNAVSQSQ